VQRLQYVAGVLKANFTYGGEQFSVIIENSPRGGAKEPAPADRVKQAQTHRQGRVSGKQQGA